jgi:enoyl-CoA hydratase/carnithine racemase
MIDDITYDRRDDRSVVELNRPEKLNAMTLEMWEVLPEYVERASDDGARAVVLTGAGDTFCAGDDIGALADVKTEQDVRELVDTAMDCFRAMETATIPVVGQANGSAYGGGFELLLACDVAVVPETATFALPEVQIGAFPFYAAKRLARLVGRQRAMDLALSSREIRGQRAAEWGLFARAAPAGEVAAAVDEFVRNVASAAPASVETTKAWLNASLRFPGEDDAMRTGMGYLFAGPDAREGARAFLEDREPEYSG